MSSVASPAGALLRSGEPLAGVCRLSMAPLRLTDEQLDAVFRAARPLRVQDRDAFLQDVAAALQGRSLATAIFTAPSRLPSASSGTRR
jgi:hypothetical protein